MINFFLYYKCHVFEEVKSQNINSNEEEEVLWLNKPTDSIDITLNESISMAKIYAKRDEIIQMYKFRIGLLSSSLLENPELKVRIFLFYYFI